MPPHPLNGLELMVEFYLGLEKSGKSQGISYCLESGNPVNGITFLNHTVVEFHHPLLDHFCCKLLYDQNFNIISYFDFQKWILI